ncbi:MAG: phosphodiester glycosidase family protein [Elainellaceae cyanobacterium]
MTQKKRKSFGIQAFSNSGHSGDRPRASRVGRSPKMAKLWLLLFTVFLVADAVQAYRQAPASPTLDIANSSTNSSANSSTASMAMSNSSPVGRQGTAAVVETSEAPAKLDLIRHLLAQNTSTQGSRIQINGRTVNGRWTKQGNQIHLAETTLMQSVGVDLLSTDDASSQPIQWFSDEASSSIDLATDFDGQGRALDLTSLTQAYNWQVRTQGDVLAIATPASQILSLRHGNQSWGDRLVIDLDQPTPFQTDLNADSVSITLDARLSNLIPLPDPDTTNTLSSLSLTPQGNQTRLDLRFSSQYQARVWTVPSPPRLVVDLNPGFIQSKTIQWQPGVWWRQGAMNLGSDQFPVVFIEIDPRQPNVSLKPIWTNPSAMPGIAPLASTAQRWQAAGAINAGFFNRNNQLPLGAIRRDREWISGPILNRGAIAWNQLTDLGFSRLTLRETVTLDSGQFFPSLHLNSGYVQAGLSRYTPAWGASYTPLTDYETLITVQNDRVTSKQLIESAGSSSISIPRDGYVLSARSYRTAADAMPIGSGLQPDSVSVPPIFEQYSHVMGAGPLLIQNGQIVLNAEGEGFSSAFARQGAARSAIAKMQSGNIVMLTVTRRVNGSGPTLAELAQILKQMGATDALNLDGGNSASLFLGGQLINRPASSVARVHNGIGLFITP